MTPVLCIDSGNTRLKWGLRQGDAWLDRGALSLAEIGRLPGADRIVACNVAGEQARRAIESLPSPVTWVRAQAEQCGVRNGYERPEQLGTDRWCALIGARALFAGPALVVMCGTATTIDVLDADGMHKGGLILPGLDMMRASLAAGTADLPAAGGEWRDPLANIATNTLDAIASGCLAATLGAIREMARRGGLPPIFILLSGGAAAAVSPHLALPHRVVDNLVLEGLARYPAGQ